LHSQPSRFENFLWEKPPDLCLQGQGNERQRGGKGLKVPTFKGRGKEGKHRGEGSGKDRGNGPQAGEMLHQGYR